MAQLAHGEPERPAAPALADPLTGRVAGAVLILVAILTVVAMAHHPTGHHARDAGSLLTLSGFVHATMIGLLAANVWGLTIFAARQGSAGWMLAGILGYGIGFIGHLIAALINGFVVPAVAAAVDRAASHDLFVLLWHGNQAAARLGIYATGVAFAAWSVPLLLRRRPADVSVGALGLLAAAGPAVALFLGAMTLNVQGALIAYGAHGAWTGLVGLQMLRRRL